MTEMWGKKLDRKMIGWKKIENMSIKNLIIKFKLTFSNWKKLVFVCSGNFVIEILINNSRDLMITDNSKKIKLIVYIAGGGGALLLIILVLVIVVFVVSRRRWVFRKKKVFLILPWDQVQISFKLEWNSSSLSEVWCDVYIYVCLIRRSRKSVEEAYMQALQQGKIIGY